jgi:hypothetical protein
VKEEEIMELGSWRCDRCGDSIVARCAICAAGIPAGRLRAQAGTQVCVKCSEQMGGEWSGQVRVKRTSKPGSIKRQEAVEGVQWERKNLDRRREYETRLCGPCFATHGSDWPMPPSD